jgi:hypothetical protein
MCNCDKIVKDLREFLLKSQVISQELQETVREAKPEIDTEQEKS